MHFGIDVKPGYFDRHKDGWVIPEDQIVIEATIKTRQIRCPKCGRMIPLEQRFLHPCAVEYLKWYLRGKEIFEISMRRACPTR